MAGLKSLLEFQLLENTIPDLEKRLKSIPEFKELKKLKQEIEDSQAETMKANEELAVNKSNLKAVEDSISLLKEKINSADTELYSGGIANVKELEAAERNITQIREKVTDSEEKALKLMELLESNQNSFKELLAVLDQKKQEFRRLHKFYNEKKLELAQLLEEAKAKRDQILQSVNPELLEKYYETRRRFADNRGIAELQNGVCSGCHMTVSFDLLKQAKKIDHIISCDNCGRLLVVD